MKGRHLIFSLLVATAVFLYFFYPSNRAVRTGQVAPDFSLKSLDGATMKLQSFRGQVVLLNFWASWCPPCVMEMPSLHALHEHLHDEGFTVVAVSVDDGWGPVRHFFKYTAVSFPVLLDEEGMATTLYDNDRLPESFLIDRAGRVVEIFAGARDWNDPLMVERIRALLKERVDGT